MNVLPGEKHVARVRNIESLGKISSYIISDTKKDAKSLQVALGKFVTTDWLVDLLNYELKEVQANAAYTPLRATYSGMEVMDNDLFSIFLYKAKVSDLNFKTLLTIFSSDKVVMSLSKSGLVYNLYEQKMPEPVDEFNKDKKLNVLVVEGTLKFLDTLLIEKNRIAFSNVGTVNGDDLIAIVATVKSEASFEWEYDANTLYPTRIVGDPTSCRIQHTCNMAGEMDLASSLPVLGKLLIHPMHNVRWEAARSIMMIDFEEGCKALQALEHDKHIEVRNAVQNAFVQINNL
jgi:hypothetical protein